MKNTSIKRLALLLSLIMIFSAFATACTGGDGDETEPDRGSDSSVGSDEADTGDGGEDGSDESGSATSDTDKGGEDTSDTEPAGGEDDTDEDDTDGKADSEADTDERADSEGNTVESDTEKQPEVEPEDTRFEKEYAPVLYFSPEEIAKIAKDYEWGANKSNMLGAYVSEDKSYVTLIPFDGEEEACFYLFQSIKKVGPFMAIKYRTKISGFYMEFFTNSVDTSAQAGSNFNVYGIRCDGEWDTRIVDLKEKLPTTFDGKKLAHMRFDFANGSPIPPECELDIEYIAFFNTKEDAQKFEYGEDYVAPEEGGSAEGDSPLYFGAVDILSSANANEAKNLDSARLSDDLSYVTFTTVKGGANDAYINLLTSPKASAPYVAIKYRTKDSGFWVETFMDSVNKAATGGSNFSFHPDADGEWHIFVLNVKDKLGEAKYDGETVNYIRFDFANCNDKLGEWSIDFEYIAFYNTEEEAFGGQLPEGGENTDESEKPEESESESTPEGGETEPESGEPVFIMDADYIAGKIKEKATNIESCTVNGDGSFVTVNPKDGIEEAYAYLFTATVQAGRYMVVKYKTVSPIFYMQIYLNTPDHSAGNGSISIDGINNDGSWQYGVFDLNEKLGESRFDGENLGHFRFDFINMKGGNKTGADTAIDIAYVAFFDSLEAAKAYAVQ